MRPIDADALPVQKVYAVDEAGFGANFYMVDKTDIDNAPTIEAEPIKHGRWLPQIVLGAKAWDCSECATLGSPHWKRCPVCEAKMDGDANA